MTPSAEPDPYAVLGVVRTATEHEIRAAYRALVARYHPDRHQDKPLKELASAKLAEINRAHIRALSRCNEALIRATDEARLLQQVCQIVVEEAGYRLCWVGSAENDESKSVRPVSRAGFDEGFVDTLNITWADTERGQGPTGTFIRRRETAISACIASDPQLAPGAQRL